MKKTITTKCFLLKEDGRNRWKNERLDMLGQLPGKSHVECHFVGFPPGKKLF